jgi:hypothetical protein
VKEQKQKQALQSSTQTLSLSLAHSHSLSLSLQGNLYTGSTNYGIGCLPKAKNIFPSTNSQFYSWFLTAQVV